MKYTTLYLLMTSILFAGITSSHAQESNQKLESDGVVVTYQFDELKGKKAEQGPKDLCLMIQNNNEHAVKITFTLAFMEDGFATEESAPMELCAAPGKMLKGKKLGLCWLITKENDEKLSAGTFDWELNDFKVEKVESCK